MHRQLIDSHHHHHHHLLLLWYVLIGKNALIQYSMFTEKNPGFCIINTV